MDFLDRMRTRAQARARGSYLGERTGKSLCFSQHDMNAANASGATVRADYNNALVALATQSSGATAPSTTFAYQPWADTTTSLMKQRNGANTAWLVRGTLAESFILARSSNTIVGVSNFGQVLDCTSTFTQTLTAAATLGDGFYFSIKNSGSGVITVDPNASETIDGSATITVQPGEGFTVWCNGSNFITIGRANINGLTEDAAPDLDADYIMVYDASAGGLKKVKLGRIGSGAIGTPVASTSGTTKDFTIPAWAQKIIVNLSAVSTAGTSDLLIQLGDSGGVETTGYSSTVSTIGATVATTAENVGFGIVRAPAASDILSGQAILSLENSSGNTWTCQSTIASTATVTHVGAGKKSLTGALTTVRVTSLSADAFDAGEINVFYE